MAVILIVATEDVRGVAVAAGSSDYYYDDGKLICNDVGQTALDAALAAYSPAMYAAKCKKLQCSKLAAQKRNEIIGTTSPAEMASWPIKRGEALAWQASGIDSDAPNLVGEAEARGCSVSDLVARVAANAAELLVAETAIAGVDGGHRDAIDAIVADKNLNDDEKVASIRDYDITTGWPEPKT
ncbi:MAG: hypothetical protein OEV73_00035 [Desulfobulbaceae bacterium]|nr:hypothetical protein [Desulfobulbaceae bacterium]